MARYERPARDTQRRARDRRPRRLVTTEARGGTDYPTTRNVECVETVGGTTRTSTYASKDACDVAYATGKGGEGAASASWPRTLNGGKMENTIDELKTHQRRPRVVIRSKFPTWHYKKSGITCAATAPSAP